MAVGTGLSNNWALLVIGISVVAIVSVVLVLAMRRDIYPAVHFGSVVVGWWQPDYRSPSHLSSGGI